MEQPRINVTRSSMPPMDEYVNEIAPLWDTHWLTNMGVKHQELEESLARFLKVRNVRLFTNGHAALECMLEAMGLQGKVITTPFTFASTTHAIVRKGMEPVFADVRPSDLTIDPASVEKLIDSSTCAILPVHVYGCPCDVDALQDIARKYNLKLIYDAAHAFGVSLNEQPICTYGDASMLSFHATKVFNTIEGGAVCFKDESLATKLERWRNFGIEGPDDVEYAGGNAKMDEFRAAMGICNLRHVESDIQLRAKVNAQYHELLDDLRGVRLIEPVEGTSKNYAYMPVLITKESGTTRDRVAAALAEQGFFARKYFYPLTSTYACYKGRFTPQNTPVALEASHQVLTLPMYAGLKSEDVSSICHIIERCVRQ